SQHHHPGHRRTAPGPGPEPDRPDPLQSVWPRLTFASIVRRPAVREGSPEATGRPLTSESETMMKDEYLTEEELQTLKGILEEQLESLLSQSRDAVNRLTAQRETDPDPLDLAVTESNRDFTLRLADRERRLVSKIRYALDRITN